MTQDPHAAAGHTDGDFPPVDEVIHDIRESSGHVRAPEAREPLPGTRAPGGPDEASSAHHPGPPGTAVAGAPPGTGHEASGQAPGHAASVLDAATGHGGTGPGATGPGGTGRAASGHGAADSHGDGHESGEELGPIDTANWGAGVVGVVAGVVIAACFAIATQGLGAY